MSTPLYKRMKEKGTSFYCFPSAASDLNLANYNDFFDLNFTKFALLNIPSKNFYNGDDIDKKCLNFDKDDYNNYNFFTDDPNKNSPTKLSEQLIESLRNYVANYDTTLHESRINTNTDFYTIGERNTPTENIFWKWCRKLNIIDFEPAVHNIDWNKNLSDFDNPNIPSVTSTTDYFRKYLWKERENINYKVYNVLESSNIEFKHIILGLPVRTPMLTLINVTAKFKIGDVITLKTIGKSIPKDDDIENTGLGYDTEITIGDIKFKDNNTYIWLKCEYTGEGGGPELYNTYISLKYNRLIQYVGEINQISNIQTSSRIGQEITAFIPHQAGRTPSVLFGIRNNVNYQPGLEVPILSSEIQREIVGAESLNSPIRKNPSDYPGSYFGQFDTTDKTYLCSNGNAMKLNGNYYGILLNNNSGLNDINYIEKLEDFNSNYIDGVFVDFDRRHYHKMSIAGLETSNFDEFNSISIQGQSPDDFEFNAILWYYDLVEDVNGTPVSHTNLYGIEFLNNPDDTSDDYSSDIITPYKKLVTNGVHDGNSYMFNLNIHYNIDNDVQPLTYDATTIYNMFGFDMYNEAMRRMYQVNENFSNIIQEFVRINMEIQEIKSKIYTTEEIESVKKRMNSIEELLKIYSKNQFVNSDTVNISVDYSGNYPKLKMNTVSVEYDDIKNIKITDAYNYNFSHGGDSYPIALNYKSKVLMNIINDNLSINPVSDGNVVIVLDRELKNKQKMDIIIKPKNAKYSQRLYLNMMFKNGDKKEERTIFSVDLPKDVINVQDSIYEDSFYLNENVYINCIDVITGKTQNTTTTTTTTTSITPTTTTTTSLEVNTGNTTTSTTLEVNTGNTTTTTITNLNAFVDVSMYDGYTTLILPENMFKVNNTVYVQNLFFKNTNGEVLDFSGSYNILYKSSQTLIIDLLTDVIRNFKLMGSPVVSYYRGLKVSILRVDGTDVSSFSDRYDITYKIL